MALSGIICLITGATRGIGKGIALKLGEAGATVYITGRSLKPLSHKNGGSLQETSDEIRRLGGQCIPIVCDHGNMAEVEQLFEQISREQDGRLDVLVNNAYSAVNKIMEFYGVKFWDAPPTLWDDVNNVGLRNHYFCTVYASRLMVARNKGLIVNISSAGGLKYLFNVPYGVGKEALDRMTADCAVELRKCNVAVVSLWPGAVSTENIQSAMNEAAADPKLKKTFEIAETPEFSGTCIVKLATDSNIMSRSGKIVTTADLAEEFSLKDIDGSTPQNIRSLSTLLTYTGHTWIAAFFPRWVKLPKWVLALAGNKF